MFLDNSILAIIPARGGSKGMPGKNIKLINGKPLIVWTIEEAQKSKYIDRLIISSEDEYIISVAQKWGCEAPFIRPKDLAMDETPAIDVVIDAIQRLPEYNYVVLLQPTSPLRNVKDIDGAIEHCFKKKATGCVTVTEAEKNPYWMYYLENERLLPVMKTTVKNICRRQDLPKVYVLNGAVYIKKSKVLLEEKRFISPETVAYIMPKARSLDIDSKLDLLFFEALIANDEEYACRQ